MERSALECGKNNKMCFLFKLTEEGREGERGEIGGGGGKPMSSESGV